MGEGGSGRSWHPSSSPPPSDVPSAPLLLTVEHVSDSSVTVSWEPPERPGRLGFQGYVLELLREGGELSPARTGGVGLEHSRDKPPDPAIGQSGNAVRGSPHDLRRPLSSSSREPPSSSTEGGDTRQCSDER